MGVHFNVVQTSFKCKKTYKRQVSRFKKRNLLTFWQKPIIGLRNYLHQVRLKLTDNIEDIVLARDDLSTTNNDAEKSLKKIEKQLEQVVWLLSRKSVKSVRFDQDECLAQLFRTLIYCPIR